jgi:hypothetical protein
MLQMKVVEKISHFSPPENNVEKYGIARQTMDENINQCRKDVICMSDN